MTRPGSFLPKHPIQAPQITERLREDLKLVGSYEPRISEEIVPTYAVQAPGSIARQIEGGDSGDSGIVGVQNRRLLVQTQETAAVPANVNEILSHTFSLSTISGGISEDSDSLGANVDADRLLWAEWTTISIESDLLSKLNSTANDVSRYRVGLTVRCEVENGENTGNYFEPLTIFSSIFEEVTSTEFFVAVHPRYGSSSGNEYFVHNRFDPRLPIFIPGGFRFRTRVVVDLGSNTAALPTGGTDIKAQFGLTKLP